MWARKHSAVDASVFTEQCLPNAASFKSNNAILSREQPACHPFSAEGTVLSSNQRECMGVTESEPRTASESQASELGGADCLNLLCISNRHAQWCLFLTFYQEAGCSFHAKGDWAGLQEGGEGGGVGGVMEDWLESHCHLVSAQTSTGVVHWAAHGADHALEKNENKMSLVLSITICQ